MIVGKIIYSDTTDINPTALQEVQTDTTVCLDPKKSYKIMQDSYKTMPIIRVFHILDVS